MASDFTSKAFTAVVKRTISNDQSSTQTTNNNENDSLADSIVNEAQETLNDVKSAQEAYKIERCAQLIDLGLYAIDEMAYNFFCCGV